MKEYLINRITELKQQKQQYEIEQAIAADKAEHDTIGQLINIMDFAICELEDALQEI